MAIIRAVARASAANVIGAIARGETLNFMTESPDGDWAKS